MNSNIIIVMSLLDYDKLMEDIDFLVVGDFIVKSIDESHDTGFGIQHRAIREEFGGGSANACTLQITKSDIYRQLVLIDSLYSTNIVRMRQFGIEEIAEDLWNLCADGAGNHTLATLAKKIDITKPLPIDIITLFTNKYGYIKGAQNKTATSLISKYLHFVSLTYPQNAWGFPIYDSIVCELLNKVQKSLGLSITPKRFFNNAATVNIEMYISSLKGIVDALEQHAPLIWDGKSHLKFELLDYCLWHIGKAGANSFNLLLTKSELITYDQMGQLPSRVHRWKQIYSLL